MAGRQGLGAAVDVMVGAVSLRSCSTAAARSGFSAWDSVLVLFCFCFCFCFLIGGTAAARRGPDSDDSAADVGRRERIENVSNIIFHDECSQHKLVIFAVFFTVR